MVYPYGLQNFPAVGGGSPGLPRRQALAAEGPRFDPSRYSVVGVGLGGAFIRKMDGAGSLLGELAAASLSSFAAYIDHDGKYLSVKNSPSTGGVPSLRLVDLQSFSFASQISIGVAVNVNISTGVAQHPALGVIALATTDNDVNFYKLDDVIGRDGGNLNGLTLEGQITGLPYTGKRFAWNPQGTLFACVYGGNTSAQSGRHVVYKWPSLEVAMDLGVFRATTADLYSCAQFSDDGRFYLGGYANNSTDVSSVEVHEIAYDSSGQYVDSELVYAKSGAAAEGNGVMAVVEHEIILLSVTADGYRLTKIDTSDNFSAQEHLEPFFPGVAAFVPGISKDGQLRSFHVGITTSGSTIPPANRVIVKRNERDDLFSPTGMITGVVEGGTGNRFTAIVGG